MCIGKAVDGALGSIAQPYAPGKLANYVPTLGESMDPHYMRTNSKGEARHEQLGVHKYDTGDRPDPPPPPVMPQGAKAPNTMPLRRRNMDAGFAMPNGSTVLTGPSGVALSQLNLGSASALGG